ncbi:MAG: transcriptional repressor LexA [Deltaproteobacteria bacterium]|nr:transcriptional repressor LexA [Deltaproteobacteria bacterium]
MLSQLTPRQKQIYEFLLKSVREKGYAPSIPEIGRRFKIASTNGVSDHLKALEKKGYIRRVGKRALEILTPLGRPALTNAREIPILGRVAAGKPILAEENFGGFLTVAGAMAQGEVFALQVKGDSMIEAGILDGDWVIVKCQETAANGEIVCALIDGEATLKRFYKSGDGVTLQAENKSYPPITVSKGEFRILGKVTGLTRKF